MDKNNLGEDKERLLAIPITSLKGGSHPSLSRHSSNNDSFQSNSALYLTLPKFSVNFQ